MTELISARALAAFIFPAGCETFQRGSMSRLFHEDDDFLIRSRRLVGAADVPHTFVLDGGERGQRPGEAQA